MTLRACEMHPELKKIQMVGRPFRHREFRFSWSSHSDPTTVSSVVVGALGFDAAVEAFFARSDLPSYKANQQVPLYFEMQLNPTGGWIVHCEAHTVWITIP